MCLAPAAPYRTVLMRIAFPVLTCRAGRGSKASRVCRRDLRRAGQPAAWLRDARKARHSAPADQPLVEVDRSIYRPAFAPGSCRPAGSGPQTERARDGRRLLPNAAKPLACHLKEAF